MAARQSLVVYRTILFFTILLWMRGEDSNLRPPGYGPGKLPLLYRAVFGTSPHLPTRRGNSNLFN